MRRGQGVGQGAPPRPLRSSPPPLNRPSTLPILSALLAPRFIASAFITGPAFVILLLQVIRRFTGLPIGEGPLRTLTSVMRVTVLLNLFMLGSELFTAFYTGGSHATAVRYLFFGSHGHHALVPWIWTAVALNLASAVVVHLPATRRHMWMLNLACVLAFAGVWIEKRMGLITPAFVPSTLHEVVEYVPTLTEWKITAGTMAKARPRSRQPRDGRPPRPPRAAADLHPHFRG